MPPNEIDRDFKLYTHADIRFIDKHVMVMPRTFPSKSG
jgi:hypothetical protein